MVIFNDQKVNYFLAQTVDVIGCDCGRVKKKRLLDMTGESMFKKSIEKSEKEKLILY